jgi:hypothetical protein
MNDREQLLLEQWKMASQFHLQMDNMAWQRASYFMAANGVLLAALGAVLRALITDSDPIVCLLKVILVAIPLFGAFFSWVWTVAQKRAQLYTRYRMAQAKQTEEALMVAGERILTLQGKGISDLSEQDFRDLKDSHLSRSRIYLKSCLGRTSVHTLIFWTAVVLGIGWVVLLPFVLWDTFGSIWICVFVSLAPAFLWLWLVWDACLLPCMMKPLIRLRDRGSEYGKKTRTGI